MVAATNIPVPTVQKGGSWSEARAGGKSLASALLLVAHAASNMLKMLSERLPAYIFSAFGKDPLLYKRRWEVPWGIVIL